MSRTLLVLAILSLPQVARADDLAVLSDKDAVAPNRLLRNFLLAEAKKAFDARLAALAQVKTPDDVQKRQAALRATFIDALGGFPDKTPLNAQVVGKESFDGYRIERVIYESRPGHHVTATLYLPAGDGPFPGVLMPIGHSVTGKAADYVQRGAILLAKNGLACLAYDPIGQGERRQLLDVMGKAAIPSSTNEHTLVGVGAMLVGEGTATYRIWDGIRSLDYLAGRPEIDAKRLGCTGCSGGGTLTSYLMALDDRIVAAAPSTASSRPSARRTPSRTSPARSRSASTTPTTSSSAPRSRHSSSPRRATSSTSAAPGRRSARRSGPTRCSACRSASI
jgi:dienelactone hydrolase